MTDLHKALDEAFPAEPVKREGVLGYPSAAVERLKAMPSQMPLPEAYDLDELIAWAEAAQPAASEARVKEALDAAKGLAQVLLPIHMQLCEAEMLGEPVPDAATLFSFMGSGASDHSTVGEYRSAMGRISALLTPTQEASDHG